MLLLTVKEWLGPSRKIPPERYRQIDAKESIKAFATNLTLGDAIRVIRAHEEAYNSHFDMAVEFSLIAVSEINPLSDSLLESMRVEKVESLKMQFD